MDEKLLFAFKVRVVTIWIVYNWNDFIASYSKINMYPPDLPRSEADCVLSWHAEKKIGHEFLCIKNQTIQALEAGTTPFRLWIVKSISIVVRSIVPFQRKILFIAT